MIKLFTERLIIRDLEFNDLENHHKLLSDKNVMYYLQDIQTSNLDESKENLNNVINDQNKKDRKYYFFIIENKETKEFMEKLDIQY